MKKHLYRLCFMMIALMAVVRSIAAESVSFKANAPMIVAVGETFRIEFALNAKPEGDSFTAPEFKGFDVLAGPAVSQGSSIQIVNGKMSKSVNISYTYVVVANDPGNYTVGGAKVEVDDKSYTSQLLPIEVVAEKSSSAAQQQGQSQQQGSGHSSQSSQSGQGRIAKDDILLRTIVSRTSLYKGEPLRATIKLYSRVAIAGAENEKMPTFNGFWSQEIENNSEERIQRETYNGKVYETQVLRDYMLYPQQSGDLYIEAAQMDIIAQVIMQSRNIDPFFGGGHEVYNVKRHIEAPKIKIDVKNLPAGAPASFSGAVGSFTINATAPQQSISANSSATLTLKVSGRGNLSFVNAPKVDFPASFEKYSIKTTESITPSSVGGSVGYKQYEYPFIARSQGEYTIPAVEFTYFDPKIEKYMTLTTKEFAVGVEPDGTDTVSGGVVGTLQRGISKEDVKMLGQDIRFIRLDHPQLFSRQMVTVVGMLSWMFFFVALLIMAAIFAVAYFIIKRKIRNSENVVATKGKRANKVAVQRFKLANKYMTEANERAFYEEMLHGLWGYMSDKFNIPVANLTRENVREQLGRRNVKDADIQAFAQIISSCEEAQYSPMASSHMGEIYAEALRLVSRIETQIKR